MATNGELADLGALADRIGYRFGTLDLLAQALTHTSFVNESPRPRPESNERLEFLGDAVLGLIAAEHLFARYPETPEGELTAMRAALVRGETLERIARDLDLGPSLRLGRGEESAGGRDRATILGRALEAVIGAIYRDGGYEAARDVALRLLGADLARIDSGTGVKDERSRLQELLQQRRGVTPRYRQVDARGPDHAPTFVFEVLVGANALGRGSGPTKQGAARAAAAAALAALGDVSQAAPRERAAATTIASAPGGPTAGESPPAPREPPPVPESAGMEADWHRGPERPARRSGVIPVVAALAALTGAVWIAQGLGVLPGSFMSGDPRWAIAGALLLGLAPLAVLVSRRL